MWLFGVTLAIWPPFGWVILPIIYVPIWIVSAVLWLRQDRD